MADSLFIMDGEYPEDSVTLALQEAEAQLDQQLKDNNGDLAPRSRRNFADSGDYYSNSDNQLKISSLQHDLAQAEKEFFEKHKQEDEQTLETELSGDDPHLAPHHTEWMDATPPVASPKSPSPSKATSMTRPTGYVSASSYYRTHDVPISTPTFRVDPEVLPQSTRSRVANLFCIVPKRRNKKKLPKQQRQRTVSAFDVTVYGEVTV